MDKKILNIQNKDGNTPLHLAIINNVDLIGIRELITNENISIINNNGDTIYHLTVNYKHINRYEDKRTGNENRIVYNCTSLIELFKKHLNYK